MVTVLLSLKILWDIVNKKSYCEVSEMVYYLKAHTLNANRFEVKG